MVMLDMSSLLLIVVSYENLKFVLLAKGKKLTLSPLRCDWLQLLLHPISYNEDIHHCFK